MKEWEIRERERRGFSFEREWFRANNSISSFLGFKGREMVEGLGFRVLAGEVNPVFCVPVVGFWALVYQE